MDIRRRYTKFRKLLRENFQSFQSLGLVRESLYEPKRSKPRGHFEDSYRSVMRMAALYARMAGLAKEERESLIERLRRLRADSEKAFTTIELAKRMGYDDSSVMEDALETWYKCAVSISTGLQVIRPNLRLEQVITLHDMIRYLHAKGIESMFDNATSDKQGRVHKVSDRVKFVLVDLNEEENKEKSECKPLDEMIKAYHSFIDRKRSGSEEINALVDTNYLNAHIAMGYHSADLTVMLDGADSFINLRYNESKGYSTSDNRQRYIHRCLEELRFGVESKNGQLAAILRDKGEDVTTDALHEITRLLSTCKDLDLGLLSTDSDVSFAYDYFFNGGVSLKQLLSAKKSFDELTKDESRNPENRLACFEHLNKGAFREMDETGREFIIRYVAEAVPELRGQAARVVNEDGFVYEESDDLPTKYDIGSMISMFETYYKNENSHYIIPIINSGLKNFEKKKSLSDPLNKIDSTPNISAIEQIKKYGYHLPEDKKAIQDEGVLPGSGLNFSSINSLQIPEPPIQIQEHKKLTENNSDPPISTLIEWLGHNYIQLSEAKKYFGGFGHKT